MAAHRYWRINVKSNSYAPGYPTLAEVAFAAAAGGVNLIAGGTALSSFDYQGLVAANACDGNPATYWAAQTLPSWWGYDFGAGQAIDVAEVKITCRNGSNPDEWNQAPATWDFDWSDDGAAWTTQQSYTSAAWTAGATQTFAVAAAVVAPAPTAAPPVIVGHGGDIASNGAQLQTVVTANPGHLIAIYSYVESGGAAAAPAIASITGPAGLNFALRRRTSTGPRGVMELWWALVTTAISNATLTVAYAGGYDDAAVAVVLVDGCDQTAPFDPNPSLPFTQSFGADATPSVTVSTTNANDLLLFAVGSNYNWGGGGGATGFADGTALTQNNGATLWADLCVSGKKVTAAQNGATFTWSSVVPASQNGANGNIQVMFDALTGDSGPAGTATPAASQAFAVVMA